MPRMREPGGKDPEPSSIMSFEDSADIPPRKHRKASQISSSSMNKRSVDAATFDIHLLEQVSTRQDYEPNQPAPAEALSLRSHLVKPRRNDNEVGSDQVDISSR